MKQSEDQRINEARSGLLSIHEMICTAIAHGEQLDPSGLGSEIERIYRVLEANHD